MGLTADSTVAGSVRATFAFLSVSFILRQNSHAKNRDRKKRERGSKRSDLMTLLSDPEFIHA